MTTTIDATSQTFTSPYGLVISQPQTTVTGGLFTRPDLDPELTPWSTWHDSTGIVTRNAQPTICQSHFANVGDGISISAQGSRQSPDFTVCRVAMSGVHDDAIENDTMQAGAIVDSLFDGVFVFLSCRYGSSYTPPDGTGRTILIHGCLVRLQGYAASYKVAKYGSGQHGPLFKWASALTPQYGIPPAVHLSGCVFAADSLSPFTRGSLDPPPNCTAENVTLIWCGEGEWPNLAAWSAICPTLTVLTGREHFDLMAAAWRVRQELPA